MSIVDLPSTPGAPQTGAPVKATGTLAGGVATIPVTGMTASSTAVASYVTPAGTLGQGFKCVCSAGQVVVTSLQSGGTTQALDTSTIQIVATL